MMNMTNPVRVACIGAGYFSQFHNDAWQRIDAVELVGVADTVKARAASAGEPAFTDVQAMLDQTHPDLVDIVTPPSTHLSLIQQAISAGVSAVICQKPFCADLATARQAVEIGAAAGVPIIVHENFRFQPWYRLMKQQIDRGLCGDIQRITFRLRTGDGQGADAYLKRQPYFQTMPRLLIHETGVHWIDTFRFLLGEPIAVYADLVRHNPVINGEDAGYFILSYQNGARALFDGNRLLDNGADDPRLTLGDALIEGSQASLRLATDGSVHVRSFGGAAETTLLAAKPYAGFGGDCVYALQSHVINALLHNLTPENLAADYLRNIDIEEAIYRSAASGCKTDV